MDYTQPPEQCITIAATEQQTVKLNEINISIVRCGEEIRVYSCNKKMVCLFVRVFAVDEDR